MNVAAVVLNWNGEADTRLCLSSLRASKSPVRTVLVDNGSTDGSRERLARDFPEAHLVALPENRGFCAGANAGAAAAVEAFDAEALFFLNNDARIDPDALAPLEAELRDPAVGAAGPRVFFDDDSGRIWCLGGRVRFGENVSALGYFASAERDLPGAPFDCDYVPGCAILVRSDLFLRLGGFDEEYFAYMEDVDLGLRMRAAGMRCRAVPGSRAFHAPSSSTGGGYSRGRKYANAVNSVRFLRRHGTPARWLAFWLFDVAGLPVAWLRARDPGAVAAKARGLLAGLRGARVGAGDFSR